MKLYATLLFLHVLAVVIWVGGMFLMHFAVRPVAVAQLAPPQRLPLLAGILGRFFDWVTTAVTIVVVTGVAMIARIGASVDGVAFREGLRMAHPSVHLMFAVGLLMAAIYAYIRLAAFVRLRRALAAGALPVAAANLDLIRKLVAVNLVLGIATTGIATVGRAL